MRWPTFRAFPALLALAPAAFAFTPLAIELQPESRLWLSGTSTVRSFECSATEFDAKVDALPNAVTGVLNGDKAVTAVELRVPASRLDCKNGTMNEHMLKALKAKENPTIVFKLESYELAKATDAVRVTLNGTLSLGGVDKPITLTANATQGPSGALRIAGTHELRMKDWGLKPPTLMLGTMKVDERIKIAFDLVLKG
jgi:polyisoprenoid-binding protein YceI